MEAKTDTTSTDREAIVVNRTLSIEVSLDEILDDLLYPATRAVAAK